MLWRKFTFLLLCAVARSNLEAAVLKGVIIANEVGGPPMANVQVGVAGASPAGSDSLGMFTLEFPQKHPGDTVRLVVSKEGYEVVNDIQLELALPNPAEARIATILLCKQGSREEMARRFYRLKSFEAIEETYKKRLKELEETQQATAAALDQLEKQRNEAKGAAENTADELATRKPGETSELNQQAMRLFLDGKIEQALKVLDTEKLRRLVVDAKEKKAEAQKAIEEATQSWLLRARLLTVQFRFAEAGSAYQEAIDAAPDSFVANFAFALFSQNLNRYEKALPLYLHCLVLAKRSGNDADVAMTRNNLGLLHSAQNRMEEAREAYEEALKIYEKFAKHDPEQFLPRVTAVKRLLEEVNR